MTAREETMVSAEQALRRILGRIRALPPESVPVLRACGRVLARAVRAREDMPPFDNSTLDGYALRASDAAGASRRRPAELPLGGTIRAGTAAAGVLRPQTAVKIMTGAPIPSGADAVVMREEARVNGGGAVKILRPPERGDWIRRRGEDLRAGAALLAAGTRIRPYELAALAAQGIARVEVRRRPSVAILSTGDELVDASRTPGPWRIRDSNRRALAGALESWGARVSDLGIVRDEPEALERALRRALGGPDAVVVSGGVSVGDFDFVRPLLKRLGVEVVFWKVRIKPGKPMLFGVRRCGGGAPVFGLPGNPVSALVCLEEFVRPALEKMQGLAAEIPRFHLRGRAVNAYPLPRDRRQYLFCRAVVAKGGFALRVLRPQASHRMAAACRANALALPGPGSPSVSPGDLLPFRWL